MTLLSGNTKLMLEGKGPITIGPNDHLATGGEGAIYKKATTVIKLYTDSQKMLRDGMVDKIRTLTPLSANKYLIAPQGVVLDERNNPKGYYMEFSDGEPLPRLFTNDFRTLKGFTDKDNHTMVARMREVGEFAHSHHAIMVDANEFNWLAVLGGKDGPEPRILDVDSWAIGQWPAKVIMPSIRDYHTKDKNELTDWFSLGVVTFQLYTGIHPYKGRLDGYKPSELEKRMRDNASVFAPGIGLNNAVRDFNCIPAKLRNWYFETFQHGHRSKMPSPFDVSAVPAAAVTRRVVQKKASGLLVFDRLFHNVGDQAVRIFPCGIALLKSGNLYDLSLKRSIGKATSLECEVARVDRGWLIADKEQGRKVFRFIPDSGQASELSLTMNYSKVLRYGNRMFVLTETGLWELFLKNFGKPILAPGVRPWQVLHQATRLYDGVGIMDAMGATYLIAPFGDAAVGQVRVKELDGYKPISAKAGDRFVTVMTQDRNGEYQKFELTFSAMYDSYTVEKTTVDSPELNLAILPKGACATIIHDGELVVFSPRKGTVHKYEDGQITTAMILSNWENKVVYVSPDGDAWSVTTKK